MKAPVKQIALKEWASAIKALREGKQILVLRKGGIVEETRDFQVESHHFYLYPTYEHQKRELLKEAEQHAVDETLAGWSPDAAEVELTAYADVAEDIEVLDQEQLDRLSGFHIWTDTFAEERLKWKRKNPLHVLLLRVYQLEEPVSVPIRPDYLGCKSWVEIADPMPEVKKTPVLTDEEFARQCDCLKSALAASDAAGSRQ
ncbi:DUF1802 family protein [Paenibacillus sp. YN15]|uniref:DUF1802 family protein n=1 Tax=Paenibacillus sp. YN15 TaxID=1742774 RepID=UPI000DCF1FE4|nr:DUF1802 family protein [Paenibacillus sp. YN15]RAV06520.1 hypothetical protein DQG13_01415 [Paenibacillus sp. YN15]